MPKRVLQGVVVSDKQDKTVVVKGEPQEDPTHSALFGVMLKEVRDPLGLKTILTYPAAPEGEYQNATDYLIAMLKRP